MDRWKGLTEPYSKCLEPFKKTRKVTKRHMFLRWSMQTMSHFMTAMGFHLIFSCFGRHPRLAIDAFFCLNSDLLNSISQTEYIRKLRDCLNFAYQKAREVSKKAGSKHKRNYERARSSVLRIWDWVLVRNAGIRGRCKLADQWEKNPYIIIDQPNDNIPVYRVKLEGARSKPRILHRKLMLPFICLPTYEEDEQLEPVVSPETVKEVNELDKIRPFNANLDLFLDRDSGAAYDGGILDNSHCSYPQKVWRYKIPLRGKPGESGVLPRTVKSISVSDTESVTCSSSSEENRNSRPVRARRKHNWMHFYGCGLG